MEVFTIANDILHALKTKFLVGDKGWKTLNRIVDKLKTQHEEQK